VNLDLFGQPFVSLDERPDGSLGLEAVKLISELDDEAFVKNVRIERLIPSS
jgi:hypothetical protein